MTRKQGRVSGQSQTGAIPKTGSDVVVQEKLMGVRT